MGKQAKKRLQLTLIAAAALTVVLAVAGCNGSRKQVSHGEKFRDDDQPRAVNQLADAHIASGARADSTLHVQHFDGGQLNSLGRQKLRYMLKDDDACEPIVIYLNLPEDAVATAARREAVMSHLLDQGLLETQVELKLGTNPNNSFSSARGIDALAGNDTEAAVREDMNLGDFGGSGTSAK